MHTHTHAHTHIVLHLPHIPLQIYVTEFYTLLLYIVTPHQQQISHRHHQCRINLITNVIIVIVVSLHHQRNVSL